MVDLTIVIVSYNTRDMLRDCLNSIPSGTDGITSEVWVVDNNSPDDSAGMVASEFPAVRLIANKENAGFTRGNNQALSRASGRHKVILNPDTECRKSALSILVRYLDEHPEVGAVGPKLLNTDGTLQPNGAQFPNPLQDFLVITELRKLAWRRFERWSRMREDFDAVSEVDAVSGACMMVRGDVMGQVGLLDEEFFMFYEEIEWCWRIKRAGYKVMYVPESEVVHHWMGSVRQNSKAMATRLFQSSDIYYRKTGTPVTRFANRATMTYAAAKNQVIHAGVRVKRWLRERRGPR